MQFIAAFNDVRIENLMGESAGEVVFLRLSAYSLKECLYKSEREKTLSLITS